MITCTRYHDISCGHRVHGHEGKCSNLHGHNYRFHFTCEAEKTDDIGRVVDFGVIKSVLCEWLEVNWDHNMLLWKQDPLTAAMHGLPGVMVVDFNPTAEAMAEHLLNMHWELGDGVRLVSVVVDETRKCSAGARR